MIVGLGVNANKKYNLFELNPTLNLSSISLSN